MPGTLGDAYIHIIPTTEGISDNITKALGGESEKAGKTAGKSMLGGIATVVGGGAAALAGAATVIGGTMIAGAKGVAEYGDNIDKMSQKIGISAEEYQKWDYVMARAGTSVDVMKNGMKTLSAQAQNNSDAFKKLGISQEEAAKMSNNELFMKAVQHLSGMEEGAERTTLATQLLGKAGLEMGPLFNGGTEAIEEQMKMAEEYGMIMSDDMVAASATFQDSMETLGRTMKGIGNSLLGELLPTMTEVTDGLANIFAGNVQEGAAQISQGIQDLVGSIAAAIPGVIEVGKELVLSLGKAIMDNTPTLLGNVADMMSQFTGQILDAAPDVFASGTETISSLADGLLQNAPAAIESSGQVMNDVLDRILTDLPRMMESGVQLIQNLAVGLLQNGPAVLEAIANVLLQLLQTIASHLPEILQKGIELIGQLAAGIINAIPDAVAGMGQVLSNLKDAVTQVDWGALGKAIIDGIIAGLRNAGDALFGALKGLAGEALKAAKGALKIESPSKVFRDQVGAMIPAGIAEGIEDNAGVVTDAMADVEGQISDSARSWMSGYTSVGHGRQYNYGGFNINVYQAPGQSSEELVDLIEERINGKIMSKQAVFA